MGGRARAVATRGRRGRGRLERPPRPPPWPLLPRTPAHSVYRPQSVSRPLLSMPLLFTAIVSNDGSCLTYIPPRVYLAALYFRIITASAQRGGPCSGWPGGRRRRVKVLDMLSTCSSSFREKQPGHQRNASPNHTLLPRQRSTLAAAVAILGSTLANASSTAQRHRS